MLVQLLNRLERIDYLIRTKSTGSPAQLARRLQISERTLYDFLSEMKDLGAPMKYCKTRRTYYYEREWRFLIKYRDN